jgi:hypothetical protein
VTRGLAALEAGGFGFRHRFVLSVGFFFTASGQNLEGARFLQNFAKFSKRPILLIIL